MISVIFIVGLPASGKTTLANKINDENGGIYKIVDDPKNFNLDIKPYLGGNMIITDPNLCREDNRENAIKMISSVDMNIKIDWIFFENNPKLCLVNALNRDGGKVKSSIFNLTRIYKIPQGANIIPVFNSNN